MGGNSVLESEGTGLGPDRSILGEQQRPASSANYPETNFGGGAKWIKPLTQDRLNVFVGGHFNNVNLGSVLFTERKDDEKFVSMKYWSAPGLSKPGFDETNHWFKIHLSIPGSWSNYERVQLEFDPGCEAMVFETDGNPLQGITGGYGGDRRVDFIIPKAARHKKELDIVIEVSCNGMFGISGIGPPDQNRYFTLASADLVVPNQEAWRLMWDFQTLRELIGDLPGNSILQNRCLVIANKIMNTFDVNDSEKTVKECRKIAEDIFGEGWEAKGEKIYEDTPGFSKKRRVQVWGMGNCHIDTAWLWPYSVTQQKAARSWSTQLDLMDRYPEHRFATSSAQQFKWVEQLYPKLFERIKEKVKSGQFECVGSSWVENDSIMPSGEALARQMIFGQRFFRTRFGITSRTAWLPDSFGVSGSLPQLIRGAGMANFFTQKLSWNNVNVFPHSTFNWVGIDGTQVLCHMTPVDTYTAQATVSDVRRGIWNHKVGRATNLESSDTALLAFGNGDGGGGPLNKMLENLRRIRAAGNENGELPIVSMGDSVDDFYNDIHATTDEGKTLPVWHGELYLEFHRGTYTSHGSIKKGNRHSEILMRDAEYLATLASLYHPDRYTYPKVTIDTCWEKLLLNQFHDVLPGSSIGMVYEDAEKLYAEIARDGQRIIREALGSLLPDSLALDGSPSPNSRIGVMNTLPFPRIETIPVPVTGPAAKVLASQSAQVSKDEKTGYILASAGNMTVGVAESTFQGMVPASVKKVGEGDFVLKNGNVEMKFSGGRIVSLLDVELGRELLPKGTTGGLVMFERDTPPTGWDAWDAEIHHLETSRPLEFCNLKILESGPLRASLVSEIPYGKSKIKVEISLDATPASTQANSRSFIRFDAHVDWHERHKFLKFEIPLDIHNDIAYFESAFGFVTRPTHKNTTQEAAKFEVCGHKYADLSEYGYGVALLSESKYGYAASGNVLRISLLRAATSPDPEQDQGEHVFSWAVLPHHGHFFESDVVKAAYAFNSPMRVRLLNDASPEALQAANMTRPPFSVEGAPSVILDTVKRGDDDDFSPSATSDTSVVLRLYEAYGGHARATLKIENHVKVAKAAITNLLEEEIEELELVRTENDGPSSLCLSFRGFQVITVKLWLKTVSENARRKHDSWVDVEKV
ncbi:Glycoside hydrolase, 38 vacuolar alpha mannosidase [Tulasnella sp. 403]|nr:Glycoside hydrolase, 38 vacuolar alpha mannosidase [Tulasnella sp. 403]